MARKPSTPGPAKAETIQVRITRDAYRRLDKFRSDQFQKTGRKPTIQDVVTAALEDHLKKRGAQ